MFLSLTKPWALAILPLLSLPPVSAQWSIPERIIQCRVVQRGTHSFTQDLVQWPNLPFSLATWEDLEFLTQLFPRTSVWDQLGTQGRGNVSIDVDEAASAPAEPVPVLCPAIDSAAASSSDGL